MSGGRRTPLFWAALTSAFVVVSAGFVAVPASVATADAGTPTIVDVPTSGYANEIAIDNDTVVTDVSKDVSAQTVDFDTDTVSTPTALGTGAVWPCENSLPGGTTWNQTQTPGRCGSLEVSDGTVIWSHGLGSTTTVSDLNGNSYNTVLSTRYSMESTAVSGKWFLDGDQSLVDSTTSTETMESPYGGLDLLHGDLYVPGTVENSTQGDVLIRDVNTGLGMTYPIQGCPKVLDVEAAGSWMLVTCELADLSNEYIVVDRTGVVPNRVVATDYNGSYLMLGNGYLAEVTSAGALNWTPLTGDNLDWSNLGTVASAFNDVAVSRGDSPTIAWVDSNGAHAALLPVTPSPQGAQPQSTDANGVPVSPNMTPEGFEDHVELSWPDPPAGEDLTGYQLVVQGSDPSPNGTTIVTTLPPTARSYSIPVQYAETGTARLVAENANGSSPASEQSWQEQGQYPEAFTTFSYSIDPTTDAITVNWGWNQQPDTDAPLSFNVVAGDYSIDGLPPTATSATIQPGRNLPTVIQVIAVGARATTTDGEAIKWTTPYDPPQASVAVTGLPAVATGTSVSATFTATQGAETLPIWVRYRNAASTTWTYPVDGQNVGATVPVDLTGLAPGSSYCFSTHYVDVDDTTSGWSAEQCVAIPRDDRTLTRHGSWKSLSGSGYLDKTASESVNTASSLSTALHASRVWVVATTCPTCGTLGFRIGGTTMLISLKSATTVQSADVEIPWGSDINSTVYLDQHSSGKPITIDAIAYLPVMTTVPTIATPPSRNGFECTNPSCRALS